MKMVRLSIAIATKTDSHANFLLHLGQPKRKAIKPSQPILALQSRWPQEDGYCFELRRKRLPQPTKDGEKQPPATLPDSSSAEKSNKIDQSQPQSTEQDKDDHQSQLDTTKVQLQDNTGLEERLKLLREENDSLTSELRVLKEDQQSSTSKLQGKVDALNLEKQKLEDQLLVLKAASTRTTVDIPLDNSEDPAKLLEQVHSRYEGEIHKLTTKLREKEKVQQEMDTKLSETVTYLLQTK